MITKKIILFLFLFASYSISYAQVYEIENIKAKNFRGTFELKDFGYATCYKQDKNWFVEILDRSLVRKTKTVLDFNVKSNTVISGFSNGTSFMLVFSENDKKHNLISFDYSGKILKKTVLKDYLASVYPAKNKGYYVVNLAKKTTKLQFLSNELKELWNMDIASLGFNGGIFEMGEMKDILGAGLAPVMAASSEDLFIYNHMQYKGTFRPKITKTEIHAISSEGKKLFVHKMDPNKEGAMIGSIQKDCVYLIGGKTTAMYEPPTEIWIKKLGLDGKILDEKEITDKQFKNADLESSAIPLMIKEIINTGDGYMMMGTGASCFPVTYFDKDMNFIKTIVVDRKKDKLSNNSSLAAQMLGGSSGKGDGLSFLDLIAKNFEFVTSSQKGLHELIVYFHRSKKALTLEVSSTKNPDASKTLKELDEENIESSLKINWIDVFPGRPGEGVLCYYQKKTRKITFIKFVFDE